MPPSPKATKPATSNTGPKRRLRTRTATRARPSASAKAWSGPTVIPMVLLSSPTSNTGGGGRRKRRCSGWVGGGGVVGGGKVLKLTVRALGEERQQVEGRERGAGKQAEQRRRGALESVPTPRERDDQGGGREG